MGTCSGAVERGEGGGWLLGTPRAAPVSLGLPLVGTGGSNKGKHKQLDTKSDFNDARG